MIVSKAALQAAGLCVADKDVPALAVVQIEPDGTVLAANGKAIIAVSPVSSAVRETVPLPDKEALGEVVALSAETARELVRSIGRDSQFKGLLEHVALRIVEPGKPGVMATITDGKRKTETVVRRIRSEGLPGWRDQFREAFAVVGGDGRWIVNRLRLRAVVETIEKVCPYSGDFSPVFWEMHADGTVLVRVENELTGQRAVVVLSGIAGDEAQAEWLPMSIWERRLATGFRGAAEKKKVG